MLRSETILQQEVLKLFQEAETLNGTEITYKRYTGESYSADSDSNITYDTATLNAVLMPVRSYESAQDSRLQQDDRRLLFKMSDFPSSSSDGVARPTSNDRMVIDGNTWTLNLEGEAVYETDDTDTIYFCYIRRS